MAQIPVFYSFHFDADVMRVQLIRNIGAIDDNKPVSNNDWEEVRRKGSTAVRHWIDDNMKYRRCVVVLIGRQTAERPWVRYEIEKAWNDRKGLLGIYVHNVKCPNTGKCAKGVNPFDYVKAGASRLSSVITCHDPNPLDAYNDIRNNLERWVQTAIDQRK